MIPQNIAESTILLGINLANQDRKFYDDDFGIGQKSKNISVLSVGIPNELVSVKGSTNAADFDVWKFITREIETHPMHLSEESLSEYWDRPEEDEAWLHL